MSNNGATFRTSFLGQKIFQIEVGIGSSILYTLMRVIDWIVSPSLSKMFDAHLIGQSSDVILLDVAAKNDDGS